MDHTCRHISHSHSESERLTRIGNRALSFVPSFLIKAMPIQKSGCYSDVAIALRASMKAIG